MHGPAVGFALAFTTPIFGLFKLQTSRFYPVLHALLRLLSSLTATSQPLTSNVLQSTARLSKSGFSRTRLLNNSAYSQLYEPPEVPRLSAQQPHTSITLASKHGTDIIRQAASLRYLP
ncbi:hypothetical protein BDV98DRAFT_296360 [Pterulicium gracile]|uniref:Uncharacterized protein n=1 Tax=Pterulicium gracile TaxID=1884261 RepID=A0A5C3Q477_9AGAR|nr:hypothetical protein BDV98DRAFT_296360 [Pterula gracilis]